MCEMVNRKPAFTKAEESIICDGYLEFKSTIDTALSSRVTKRMKDDVWKTNAQRCNSCPLRGGLRTASECNKKFRNIKSTLKEKVNKEKKSVHQTGGGPPANEVSKTIFMLSFYLCKYGPSKHCSQHVHSPGAFMMYKTDCCLSPSDMLP